MVHLLRALLCAAAAAAAASEPRPTVLTQDGAVEGLSDPRRGVATWLGIPFAAPPVGDLRWRPPQPPRRWWPAVARAHEFRKNCIENMNPDAYTRADARQPEAGSSEDCLYLNVFAPMNQSAAPLPVLLWIYGGGFQSGGTNPGVPDFGALYDGRRDVHTGRGWIIVTFNYRANVFGFAAGEVLRSRDPDRGTGNYGILDQRFAMGWVQRNIAAFGGDPSRVLLAGESAGANSVANHLVRRKSWGLFSAAGVMSGAFYNLMGGGALGPGTIPVGSTAGNVTVRTQEAGFRALMAAAGCADSECLIALSAPELLAAMFAAEATLGAAWTWEPAIDGVDLVDNPVALASSGRLARVPVIVGSTLYDAAVRGPSCDPGSCGEADFRAFAAKYGLAPDEVEQAVRLYRGEKPRGPAWNGAPVTKWYAAQRVLGADIVMTCPARRLARWVTQAGQPSYLYMWSHQPGEHGSELPFLFQVNASRLEPSWVPSEFPRWSSGAARFAQEFVAYWYTFAARHAPDGASPWPAYDAEAGAAMVFGVDASGAEEHYAKEKCDFWDARADRWNGPDA